MRLEAVQVGADAEFDARLRAYWRDLGAVPTPAWHARYTARLREEEGRTRYTFWGVEGGRRIGLVMLRLDADWVYPEHRAGYIAEFTVFAPWRRRGFGRRLFLLAQAWFRERGCSQIELDVLPNNRAGMAFWRSLGFALMYHRLRRP